MGRAAASGTTSVLLNLSAGRPFGVCRCMGQCADNGGAFELLQAERASFQNPEALELARAARSHRLAPTVTAPLGARRRGRRYLLAGSARAGLPENL